MRSVKKSLSVLSKLNYCLIMQCFAKLHDKQSPISGLFFDKIFGGTDFAY